MSDTSERLVEEGALEFQKPDVIEGLRRLYLERGDQGLLDFLIDFQDQHPDLVARIRLMNKKKIE